MAQIDNRIKPTGFLYKNTSTLDKYTIEIHYANGEKREFIVKVKPGSTSVLNNGNLRMQLIRKLTDKGVFDYNSQYTEIDVGTLVVRDGELRTLEELEKQQPNRSFNSNNGKHYVISDIHGMFGSYMDAIRKLKDNDILFVIGDAIDRGRNGISVLKDIMTRQKDGKKPRIIFLLGNHEKQMIECLDIINKYGLNESEIRILCKAGLWAYFANKLEVEDKKDSKNKHAQEIKQHRNRIRTVLQQVPHLQLSEREMQILYIWLDANHGQQTLDSYNALPKNEQEEIYRFLTEKAFVYVKKEIGNQKMLFVHAAPPYSQQVVDLLEKQKECGLKYCNIDENERRNTLKLCTEMRDNIKPFEMWRDAGYTTIYGHTYNLGRIEKDLKNGRICVDAGCGQKEDKSAKLALYCVDDGKEEFLEQRENDTRTTPDFGDAR